MVVTVVGASVVETVVKLTVVEFDVVVVGLFVVDDMLVDEVGSFVVIISEVLLDHPTKIIIKDNIEI